LFRRSESRRTDETSFRRGKHGREPIAAPGSGGDHVHYQPSKQTGLGCITSRPRPTVTFWEQLAYELGCNVTTAKALWEQGLIK